MKNIFLLAFLTFLFHEFDSSKIIAQVIITKEGNGQGLGGDGGPGTDAKFNNPTDVAFDKNGNMYIADPSNQRIRKVNSINGLISTVAGNGIPGFSGDGDSATSASLHFPWGIALDPAGNLYIADSYNNRI